MTRYSVIVASQVNRQLTFLGSQNAPTAHNTQQGHNSFMLLFESGCRIHRGQFLGQTLEGFKFLTQSVQLTAEHLLIVTLLPLQGADFHDPALHDGGALAPALDEIVRALLVFHDLLLHRGIKFLGHLMIGMNDLREKCDYSNAEKNPYAKRIKKQLVININSDMPIVLFFSVTLWASSLCRNL